MNLRMNGNTKPLLRGHFHQAAFFMGLGACSMLLYQSKDTHAFIANFAYSFGLLSMFGFSALYHRPNWPQKKRRFLGSLDQSGIFLMIAGSVTPVSLSLPPTSSWKVLAMIWSVAILGILASLIFMQKELPKWLAAIIYVAVGWMILPYLPELVRSLTTHQVILLVTGGILYTIGAIVYALKRPILNPRWFSYHEVFHLLVIFAAVAHFIVITEITKG